MSDDCESCDVAICPNAYECYELDAGECEAKKRLKKADKDDAGADKVYCGWMPARTVHRPASG
jgi:hypothetical protein